MLRSRASFELSRLHRAETGDKRKLRLSAAYPRDFGLAIAALLGSRSMTTGDTSGIDFGYSGAMADDCGALDDLLKGTSKCWWRKLLT